MKAIYIRTDNDQTETYLLCDSEGTPQPFAIDGDANMDNIEAVILAEEAEVDAVNDEMEAYCSQIAPGTTWQLSDQYAVSVNYMATNKPNFYTVLFVTPKPNDLPHDIILKETVTNVR